MTGLRLLILVGLCRAARSGLLRWSSRNALDMLVLLWGAWAVLNGFTHNPRDHNPITVRLSLVCDLAGAYLYARAYLNGPSAWYQFSKCMALVLMPLAALLLVEQFTLRNCYGPLGAVLQEAWVRNGRVRAAGPFGISILAGLAGAAALPLLLPLQGRQPRWVVVGGIAACVAIVGASGSSGPVGGLLAAILGLGLWRWRLSLRWVRWGSLLMLVALQIVMKGNVWDLMGRIKFVGGSQAYHRSELITQAFAHLDEWWLGGTDYTRHWLVYGIEWSQDHVDITNYYLKMGVLGGLPLMLLFIAILVKAFQYLGRGMQFLRARHDPSEYLLWCYGAALFAHCVAFLSVSYYDQSYVFVFLIVGAAGGLAAIQSPRPLSNATADEGAAADCPPVAASTI